jgi:hypothetical protein
VALSLSTRGVEACGYPPPPPRALLITALLAVCTTAASANPLQALRELYPGVRVDMMEERPAYLYGRGMTAAMTPEDAAAGFLAQHGRIFTDTALELERTWAVSPRNNDLKIFGYKQTLRGKPVVDSLLRVAVRTHSVTCN